MDIRLLTLKRLFHRVQPIEHIKARPSRKRDIVHREKVRPQHISFENILNSEIDKLKKEGN